MNDRPLLLPWAVLALLAVVLGACPIEGTLGVYRTDAAPTSGATTSDAATTDTPTAGDGGMTDADGCELADDDCSQCLQSACCEQIPACSDPPGCTCMFACIKAGTPAKDCVDMCTPDNTSKSFSQCAMKHCAATCEGAAP